MRAHALDKIPGNERERVKECERERERERATLGGTARWSYGSRRGAGKVSTISLYKHMMHACIKPNEIITELLEIADDEDCTPEEICASCAHLSTP